MDNQGPRWIVIARFFIKCLAISALIATGGRADELWQKDLTGDISIGSSTSGYRSVKLHCAEDHISVELELDGPFEGAFYTRGSYYDRRAPCYVEGDGGENVKLRVPLDNCGTHRDNNLYYNTLVLQHDPELIMPGDTAFKIECDHSKSLQNALDNNELDHGISSKIILEDADPAGKLSAQEDQVFVISDSDHVVFRPDKLPTKSSGVKDEL